MVEEAIRRTWQPWVESDTVFPGGLKAKVRDEAQIGIFDIYVEKDIMNSE